MSIVAAITVALVLPASGAAVAPGQPLVAAASGVAVTSLHGWKDGAGSWHVVGIVQNTTQSSIGDIEISLALESASNAVLRTITTGSLIGVLDPGQSSPFVAVFAPPSGYTHAVAAVPRWTTTPSGAVNSVVATTSSTCSDQTISGTLRNNGPAVAGAEVAVEFLDSTGALLDVSSEPLTRDLARAASEAFAVARSPGAPACDHLRLVASSPIVLRNLTVTTSGTGEGSVTLPAGTSCGPGCVSVPIGSTATLHAVPAPHALFSGWSGACQGASVTCTVVMNDAETADATFVAVRVLAVHLHGRGSIRSSPAGIACPHHCSHEFPSGTRVVLKVRAARRWHFVRWSRRCGHAQRCSVVMGAAHTVRATLAPDTAPLWGSLRGFIHRRASRVSVAVLDLRSGTTYLYAPADRFNTASTAKVEILGTALHRAQQQHRWLTSYEQSVAVPMIEDSDNGAADALWADDGDSGPVQRFDDLVPMPDTTVSYAWGLTQVTARDSVRLLRRFVTPNALLDRRSRSYALHLMEHVTWSQRWGVSGGVPAGVTVALKNGWLPEPSTAWTINSMGWVHGRGRNYLIAVLTDQNSSMSYGIATVEGISARIWAAL